MFFNKIKSNPLLTIVVALTFIGFGLYVSFDNTPPHWDAGRHFFNSSNYYTYASNIFNAPKGTLKLDGIRNLFTSYLYYPPAVYWVSLPFLFLFGKTYQVALASNIVWLIIYVFSWLKLTKLWQFGKQSQLSIMCFLLSSPIVIGLSREFQVDFPLLAMLSLAFLCLEYVAQKQSLIRFVLLGIVFGLGAMTKWSFILFCLPLGVIYLIRLVYDTLDQDLSISKFKSPKYLQAIGTLFTSVFVTLTVATSLTIFWYLPNLTILVLDTKANAYLVGVAEGDPQGYNFASLWFYLKVIVQHYFWLPWLIVWLLTIFSGLLLLLKNFKDVVQKNGILVFLGLVSIANLFIFVNYLMVQGNKDARYAIVLLPYFAVLFGVLTELIIKNAKLNWVKKIIPISSFVVFLVYFVNMLLPISAENRIAIGQKPNDIPIIDSFGYTNARLRSENWGIQNAIAKASLTRNKFIDRKDSCMSDDPVNSRPVIGAKISVGTTNSSWGTVWGLAEQYNLKAGDKINSKDSCWILISQENFDEIEIMKYKDLGYFESGRFDDWQNIKYILLEKN